MLYAERAERPSRIHHMEMITYRIPLMSLSTASFARNPLFFKPVSHKTSVFVEGRYFVLKYDELSAIVILNDYSNFN